MLDPIAIAKAAGFTIKQQDLHRQASELSDEELEGVSGGFKMSDFWIVMSARPNCCITPTM